VTASLFLGAVETVAEPVASVALVGADLTNGETRKDSRLLQSVVKGQVPSVGDLKNANALLLRREVTLAARSAGADGSSGTRAVCESCESYG
jgi:hypothetical protein